MSDYKNTWRRFEKIKATMEQLLEENRNLRGRLKKRDEPLVAKVRKLENFRDTTQSRWDAEIRVAREEIRRELTGGSNALGTEDKQRDTQEDQGVSLLEEEQQDQLAGSGDHKEGIPSVSSKD